LLGALSNQVSNGVVLSDTMSTMKTTYQTVVIGFGNHASIEIPDKNLAEIGGNRRAPLKVTINGYTYQSTATGVDGKCMVVFPTRDREASGAAAGDRVTVTLELDDGYRHVDVPTALSDALKANGLNETFHNLTYSKRKEFARQVSEAKADETRERRIQKVIVELESK
jgi:bifunctional DNA-binding transcriptional regulator/antitoxin component of YhaV-PrlF toxin-antitoxin module